MQCVYFIALPTPTVLSYILAEAALVSPLLTPLWVKEHLKHPSPDFSQAAAHAPVSLADGFQFSDGMGCANPVLPGAAHLATWCPESGSVTFWTVAITTVFPSSVTGCVAHYPCCPRLCPITFLLGCAP